MTTMNRAVRGKSARDPVDDVGHVGRAAADEDGRPGRRRERAARVAQVATSARPSSRLGPYGVVSVNAVRSPWVVAARAVAHEPVARPVRVAVQQLVLVERQPRVDVDEAVDAADPRVGREPPRVVVQRGEVGRASSPGRRSGRRGRAARTRPRRTRACSRSNAARDGTLGGQDRSRPGR